MFTSLGKAPAVAGAKVPIFQVLSGDSKQIVEQGNKRQADDGDTSARHELYHGELVVKGVSKNKIA